MKQAQEQNAPGLSSYLLVASDMAVVTPVSHHLITRHIPLSADGEYHYAVADLAEFFA